MIDRTIYPCILSGGVGARLWPLSRYHAPKQLHPLLSDRPLIVDTAKRFESARDIAPPIVICSQIYVKKIAGLLRAEGVAASHILAEPVRRNTAPAAALAACLVNELETGGLVLLLPADHSIPDPNLFLAAVDAARQAAAAGHIVAFGIAPTAPETGYGYIKAKKTGPIFDNLYPIDHFVEKPAPECARAYLVDGGYSWNSGIFLFSPTRMLKELERHAPDILAAARAAYQQKSIDNQNGTCIHQISKADFIASPEISIDYAVMEKTAHAAVLVSDFRWSDIGSWASIHDHAEKDSCKNIVKGDVLVHQTTNSLVRSESRLVCATGMTDTLIVETADAVLVCPKNRAQDVGQIFPKLRQSGRAEAMIPAQNDKIVHIPERDRLQDDYRDWLLSHALPFWANTVLDPVTGGSFEACSLSGSALPDIPVRLRVHARQVFAFAFALEKFGWSSGATALEKPLSHLRGTGRRDDGGWGHIYNPDGSWADNRADCYDHAFVLTALAWAYKVTGEQELKDLAFETLDYLDTALRHPLAGYHESVPPSAIRRANPHMHLLEAALYWTELHDEIRFAALADEMVRLFSAFFYKDGLVREYFHDDLSINEDSRALALVEPGHLYEWAYLLAEYERITGRKAPLTGSMTAFADKFGWTPQGALLMDQCHPTGEAVEKPGARLWGQTEFVRWALRYGTASDSDRALVHLADIRSRYLIIDGNASGWWRDRLDAGGDDLSTNSPASTLYHLVGMIDAI